MRYINKHNKIESIAESMAIEDADMICESRSYALKNDGHGGCVSGPRAGNGIYKRMANKKFRRKLDNDLYNVTHDVSDEKHSKKNKKETADSWRFGFDGHGFDGQKGYFNWGDEDDFVTRSNYHGGHGTKPNVRRHIINRRKARQEREHYKDGVDESVMMGDADMIRESRSFVHSNDRHGGFHSPATGDSNREGKRFSNKRFRNLSKADLYRDISLGDDDIHANRQHKKEYDNWDFKTDGLPMYDKYSDEDSDSYRRMNMSKKNNAWMDDGKHVKLRGKPDVKHLIHRRKARQEREHYKDSDED